MSPSRIPNHRNSHPLILRAELLLVQSASVVKSKDTIAVSIQKMGACLPSGIDSGIDLIAIRSPPMVSSESRDVGIGIVIEIEGGEVAVPEVIHEEMD